MIDELVARQLESKARFIPPVTSLVDIDFYKTTMGHIIWDHWPNVDVTLAVMIRDKKITFGRYVTEAELRQALDHARLLSFSGEELRRLQRIGIRYFNAPLFEGAYMNFLHHPELSPYQLAWNNGDFKLTFTGPWKHVTLWETIALAIISDLYNRGVMRTIPEEELPEVYQRADEKLRAKFARIKQHPGIRIVDFGLRRRYNVLWQDHVIWTAKTELRRQFIGTSNVMLADKHDIAAKGTVAHEPTMVLTALADTPDERIRAQYEFLRIWKNRYWQPSLRFMLPDTYGTTQFFANYARFCDVSQLTTWSGMRQDSGDPVVAAEIYIAWLESHGINPKEKTIIFSDGLDVDQIIALYLRFAGRIQVAFGWGTLLTNDFIGCCSNPDLRPFSIVCKIVRANGRHCVKLPDNLAKTMGPADEVESYFTVFGREGRITQDVRT